MQVTHERDHVTHAVIGGKKAIEFGISNSAEFFNILSSTLYSDQMLAVVREALCNAWDAHIDAGCTNVPITVTVRDGKFIIRDYGKGIHHDNIGPIYGTYGNSTKKNDGTQTGGFGLGCKAPFAYTDHFEVTSFHEGTMTIYAMSKSSAEVAGKPGITPIVSAPTQEHGLQVSIKIKNQGDAGRFEDLVKQVTFNGDMLVVCNGIKLPTIEFTDASPFLMTMRDMDYVKINIRYGNVIYPVERNSEIRHTYDQVEQILDKLAAGYNYVIIFQAPPHSIAVTPSRESLSMQEHTCNTLNTLFSAFIAEYNSKFEKLLYQMNDAAYQKLDVSTDIEKVLTRQVAPIQGMHKRQQSKIRTIEDGVNHYLDKRFPDSWKFRCHDLRNRIHFLVTTQKVDKGMAMTYLAELGKVKESPRTKRLDDGYYIQKSDLQQTSWFQKRIARPLAIKFMANPKMELDRLLVSDTRAILSNKNLRFGHSSVDMPGIVPIMKAAFTHLPALAPYLRNIVVLAYSRMRVQNESRIRDTAGNSVVTGSGFLLYIVNRRKDDLETAREFFTKLGMKVIDYTTMEEMQRAREPARVSKPRRKGLPRMDTIYAANKDSINLHRLEVDDVTYVVEPAFYFKVKTAKDHMHYARGLSEGTQATFFKHFGALGGIVTTERQVESYRLKGVPDFYEYACTTIFTYVMQSQEIKDYWAYRPGRMMNSSAHRDIITLILTNPYMAKHCKLQYSLDLLDLEVLQMMDAILDHFPSSPFTGAIAEMKAALDLIPVAQEAMDLIQKIDTNPMSGWLRTHMISEDIDAAPTEAKKEEVCNRFLSLLNL